MESIKVRTISHGDISEPFEFPYNPDLSMADISLRIKEIFKQNVKHLIQVGELLDSSKLAKEALGAAGFLFIILED